MLACSVCENSPVGEYYGYEAAYLGLETRLALVGPAPDHRMLHPQTTQLLVSRQLLGGCVTGELVWILFSSLTCTFCQCKIALQTD